MLEEIFYSFKLSQLQATKRTIAKVYDAKLTEFKESKDYEPMNEGALIHEEMMELELVDDQIADLQTQFVNEQIEKYCLLPARFVDTKSLDHDWCESEVRPGRYRLKPEVIVHMRGIIRAEQKERWERWTRWVPLLTGLTGLLGTLIGLIAAAARWL